ncbi:MAG: class I SAM-dependent methyltransferase [Chloroflexota bacterium]
MTISDATATSGAASESIGTRVARDFEGAAGLGLVYLGDRLGLFGALREGGPATAGELAVRTGLVERYVREWLAGVAAAGYVAYASDTQRFNLTEEQAALFADPDNALFVGATAQFLLPVLDQADAVAEAFRHGGGVPYSAYGPGVLEGFERSSHAKFLNNLEQVWLPAVPDALQALRAGGAMLDVGCGGGAACFVAARVFPAAQIAGIDTYEPGIARARATAAASNLDGRLSFGLMKAADLPAAPTYDLITAFDVLHDLADPVASLRGMRRALKPTGTCLTLDPRAADTLEGNLTAEGKFLYWASIFYCMTVSLAQGGLGLGTAMGEGKARALATEAGFTRIRRVPIGEDAEMLLELKP